MAGEPGSALRRPRSGSSALRDRESRGDALLSVLVLACAAASPVVVSRWPLSGAIAVPLAVLLLWRGPFWPGRQRSAPLIDATVLTVLIYALGAVPVVGLWPMAGACALMLAAVVAWYRGRIATWREWARAGVITGQIWLWLAVIVLLTVAGLLVWMYLVGGQLPATYRDAAHSVPGWVAGLGGFVFLVVNGIVEDAVFFGVFLTATTRSFRTAPATIVTSLAFGAAHFGGVPSGWIGVVMASAWGFVLSMLRIRTRGMLATYIAHVAADATIMVMLFPGVLRTGR